MIGHVLVVLGAVLVALGAVLGLVFAALLIGATLYVAADEGYWGIFTLVALGTVALVCLIAGPLLLEAGI